MHTTLLDDLTDALARGRLCAAEIAGLSPRELDAVFAAGAQRVDGGRYAEAAAIFGGLVALFPYSARAWRAWGVALHCRLACERARAAYDAALLLEPDHLETLCYRGEVLLYLGDCAAARRDLERVARSKRRDLVGRARALILHIDHLAGWQPLPARPPLPTEAELSLADGRSLPLEESRFSDEEGEVTREVTETARIFAPAARRLDGYEEITDTGIISGRPRALANEVTAPLEPVSREAEVTDTGLLDRRPQRHEDLIDTDLVARPAPVDFFDRGNTAIVRRRLRRSLTQHEVTVTDVLPNRRRPR